MRSLPAFWLRDGWRSRLLLPLAALYRGVCAVRRWWQQRRAVAVGVPVIVVGSIFVGGTGKTPLVIHLVAEARRRGYRPGVVLRGYGGRLTRRPLDVAATSDPADVGDEAVLIADRTGVPVVAGADRPEAASRLRAVHGCDLVIADDGLQHYRLARDAELAVIDGERGLGNGRCLPAGPLREAASRLACATVVVGNGGAPAPYGTAWFRLAPGPPQPVAPGVAHGPPPTSGDRVHGVAGIGAPDRFFRTLAGAGFDVCAHAFGDHHAFTAEDLAFDDRHSIVMTEKDAVKCRALDRGALWYLPVALVPGPGFEAGLERVFERIAEAGGSGQ